MATKPASTYFPPLDRCLNGDEVLISWKAVFCAIQSAIQGGKHAPLIPTIASFLSDPTVRSLLANPFESPPATPQTKSSYETKTSAINVTPSPDARYDIKQLKEDALWLSSVGKLDEVSALRIVVHEYQARTSAKLQGPFSETELVSARESAGDTKFSNPITVSLMSRVADVAKMQVEFETEYSRRQRILFLHLSERRYFLKSLERLVYFYSFKARLERINEDDGKKSKELAVPDNLLESNGRTLLTTEIENIAGFKLRCVDAIKYHVQSIGNGSGWYNGEKRELEIESVRTHLTEAIHTLEILFELVYFNDEYTTSQLILAWFSLLQDFEFFDQFNMEDPSLQPLIAPFQSISMAISLALLDIRESLGFLSTLNSVPDGMITPNAGPEEPFIINTKTLGYLHQIIKSAADRGFVTAGPPILAWASIMRGLSVGVNERATQLEDYDHLGSASPGPYQDTMELLMDSADDEDPIDFLARRAVNQSRVIETLNVHSLRLGSTADAFFSVETGAAMRHAMLDLIGGSNAGLGYIPEVVEALFATLSGGQNYWDHVDSNLSERSIDTRAKFLGNEDLVNAFFRTAMSRYPCESLPFLRTIHALASCPSAYTDKEDSQPIMPLLNTIPLFTYQLPDKCSYYQLAQEEENNNTVQLKEPVHLFEPRSNSIYQRVQSRTQGLTLLDRDFCIPAGTFGRIISDTRQADNEPRVVFWFHEYSALKYFGKLLETFLTGSEMVDATTGSAVDRESVVEIIDILATMLQGYSKASLVNANAKDEAQRVLEIASSGLNRNRDIITVVFDIFEEELHRQSTVSGSEVPLGILVSCVHFIHALISISPGRVWPQLANSSLLGVDRGGGRLSSIVEGVELVLGQYEFLLSCTRLFEALVEDVATNAVRRRSGPRSTGRYANQEDVGTGIPDHVLSKVLHCFTRYLVDVLESSFGWKFVTQNDRRRLCKVISTVFDKILRYVHGIEAAPRSPESPQTAPDTIELRSRIPRNGNKSTINKSTAKLASKIIGGLIPSASQIVDSFLSTSYSAVRFQPILVALLDGLETPDLTLFVNELELWTAQVQVILSYSKTLLRVNNILQKPLVELGQQLFKAAPLVARLYAVNDIYKRPVVTLFEALIVTANNVSEPPSLLGHLGPYTAKNFIHILSDLDKPLARNENTTAIWHFLSMVVSNKQQWFGNYLLTGKTPREALVKDSGVEGASPLDKPLLATALESLTKISQVPRVEAMAMLEFVALSQNFYSWTVYASPKHGDFITAITEFMGTYQPLQITSKLDDSIEQCFKIKIAAYIAEILAMHVFHSRQMRTSSNIPKLVDNFNYYFRFGVTVPSLNSSLHHRLNQNFESQYPNCTLQELKRTTLEDRQLGREYFYDLPLAEKMLRLDHCWTGKKNDGLRNELEIANVNLSLVDAQVALFHGWKVLAIELTSNISSDVELQKSLITVSLDCLTANSRSQHSDEIFTRLCSHRADFSLIITQRLIEAKCRLPEMKALLPKTWETIRNFRGTFERALKKEDDSYYRSLLKLLFIATRAHTIGPAENADESLNVSVRMDKATNIVPIIIDIIRYVVSAGIREAAANIHESPSESSPEDIALITGILNTCLHIPGIEFAQSQIVAIFIADDTARVATTLFSWSDSLVIEGDPIYGELSILFLLELSSMPLMAEQLAIDGVLGHIASANITAYLRRGNVSPFADGVGMQRCYSIWSRGILPFLLNLLDAVQASIAAEVATFLNQFEPLLDACSKAFEAPESSRTLSKATKRYISLGMCSEAHSLALLNYIISGFRDTLQGVMEIPEVKIDTGAILENVEFWLGARSVLRERILPMGERDQGLARRKVDVVIGRMGKGGAAGSKLEEMIVGELGGVRDVLSGGVES